MIALVVVLDSCTSASSPAHATSDSASVVSEHKKVFEYVFCLATSGL
jgi:hypothetical protein